MGWDKLREQTFERQKKMGVIPVDSKISPRPKEIRGGIASRRGSKNFLPPDGDVRGLCGNSPIIRSDAWLIILNRSANSITQSSSTSQATTARVLKAEISARPTRRVLSTANLVPSSSQCALRRVGRPEHLPPFRDGLGLGGQYALSGVKQVAGHWRIARWHGGFVAERHPGQG